MPATIQEQLMPSEETTLYADKEHRGIEIAVPIIILVFGVLSYLVIDSLILNPLLDNTGVGSFRPLLRLVLAVVLGALVGAGAEVLLKRVWHSGRLLRLGSDGMTVVYKKKPDEFIDWDKRVNILCWRYALRGYPRGGRERRVPAGYELMACRLLQDETSLIVHSYLSSKQAQQIARHERFTNLNMASLYSGGLLKRIARPERPSLGADQLSGQQGQVWVAEKKRWADSFELDPDDFAVFVRALDAHDVLPAR
jgi:hypothetical protein